MELVQIPELDTLFTEDVGLDEIVFPVVDLEDTELSPLGSARKLGLDGLNGMLRLENMADYSASRLVDHNSLMINAGAGLVGGGSLNGDISVSLSNSTLATLAAADAMHALSPSRFFARGSTGVAAQKPITDAALGFLSTGVFTSATGATFGDSSSYLKFDGNVLRFGLSGHAGDQLLARHPSASLTSTSITQLPINGGVLAAEGTTPLFAGVNIGSAGFNFGVHQYTSSAGTPAADAAGMYRDTVWGGVEILSPNAVGLGPSGSRSNGVLPFIIRNDGYVGIGNVYPAYPLHMEVKGLATGVLRGAMWTRGGFGLDVPGTGYGMDHAFSLPMDDWSTTTAAAHRISWVNASNESPYAGYAIQTRMDAALTTAVHFGYAYGSTYVDTYFGGGADGANGYVLRFGAHEEGVNVVLNAPISSGTLAKLDDIDNAVASIWEGLSTSYAPLIHLHSWTSITGKPSTFTPSTHTHDDRYYTESETTTLLAGKQDSLSSPQMGIINRFGVTTGVTNITNGLRMYDAADVNKYCDWVSGGVGASAPKAGGGQVGVWLDFTTQKSEHNWYAFPDRNGWLVAVDSKNGSQNAPTFLDKVGSAYHFNFDPTPQTLPKPGGGTETYSATNVSIRLNQYLGEASFMSRYVHGSGYEVLRFLQNQVGYPVEGLPAWTSYHVYVPILTEGRTVFFPNASGTLAIAEDVEDALLLKADTDSVYSKIEVEELIPELASSADTQTGTSTTTAVTPAGAAATYVPIAGTPASGEVGETLTHLRSSSNVVSLAVSNQYYEVFALYLTAGTYFVTADVNINSVGSAPVRVVIFLSPNSASSVGFTSGGGIISHESSTAIGNRLYNVGYIHEQETDGYIYTNVAVQFSAGTHTAYRSMRAYRMRKKSF